MTLTEALIDSESLRFFEQIGALLPTATQREAFARYGLGLMSSIDRKSIEPIAALYCEKASGRCRGLHQVLHRFIANSDWSDVGVRANASDYAITLMRAQAPLEVAILDDTGLVKCGKHSVGVSRQYCGRLGKIESCQVAVGLAVANGIDAVTVDAELYLPIEWATDPELRKIGKIPDDIEFRTKPQLGLMLLQEAAKRGISPGLVVADSDYGKAPYFREGIRDLDMDFAVGVHCDQLVRRVKHGRAVGDVKTASSIARALDADRFKEVRWREGSKGALKGRFAIVQVIAAEASDVPLTTTDRETLFLLVEWEEGAKEPEHFTLISFDAEAKGLSETVRLVKERWRIERCFQEMKSELGLAHFEGRSWKGWNHHTSMVITCHAFAIGVRAKVSPPGADREASLGPLLDAATASRRALLRDRPTLDRQAPERLDSAPRAA